MNAGGPGQGGQGGAGSGAGSGSQNNGNQHTTTSSAQQQETTAATANGFITTTANPYTLTTTPTQSPTSTSTSSSSSSSGNQKTAIIGGVIGGIAGVLIIALLVIWLLNRRDKKRMAEKRGSAQPVTYASLNDSFGGVPFGHSNRTSQRDSLLPPPLALMPRSDPSTPHTGVGLRGGEGHDSNADVERNSGDYFLPTYAESQAGMSLAGSRLLGRLNTSHAGSESEATVSPMSVRHPDGTPTTGISPQSTGSEIPGMMSQQTRDTMGFPVDASDIGIHRTSTPGLPIAAPVPRHPLVQQDSLERVVRDGMMNGTPDLHDTSRLGPRNGPAGRVLSQELMRESPVLGQMNPVRMRGTTAPSNLNGGVQRFESQRTVSSVSSMGINIVSDAELERLGVGSRGRHLT
jgi:hypothetical protein